ncbi:protein-glutamate O-methyltransferase CheR, partial [Candidatus Poribacteria bacterium]|nr:protein-glutamate O-methyltransferase CheR [Candidatus Poribacteria bacterium]
KSTESYLIFLKSHPEEFDNLINTISVDVSSFFRNPIVFEIINQDIIPDIIKRKELNKNREIRIWSAGCGKGEEPYSIAILINMNIKNELNKWFINIFGTDINKNALLSARHGIYPQESFETTKLGILNKYFTSHKQGYEINSSIREMVHFSCYDLTSKDTISPPDSVFGTFDIILCRNVLIYFSQELQEKVLNQLSSSLAKNGYLILGESESLLNGLKSKFSILDNRNKIYKKN